MKNMGVEERQHPILYVNGNYLYAFFGYKIGTFLETVERVNIKNVKSKWEPISLVKPVENLDLGMIGAGLVKKDTDIVIFFGGKTAKEEKRTALLLDFGNHAISQIDNMMLEDPTYFGESLLTNLGRGAYAHFNLSNNSILKIEVN